MQIDLRAPQRGDQAEDDPGEERYGEGETEHAAVDVDRRIRRQPGGVQRDQRGERPDGDQRPQDPAAQRQKHALGEELADQAQAIGAERGPDRQFGAPARGARQQQVGEVGAGDQKNKKDDGSHKMAGRLTVAEL